MDLKHMLRVVVMIVGDDLEQVFGGDGTLVKYLPRQECAVCATSYNKQSCNSSLLCKGVGTLLSFL